jgi:hypothetical protein
MTRLPMDLETVNDLVVALVTNYNDALEFYTKWQRRKWQENNYAAYAKGRRTTSGCCGLGASLSFSAIRIREAFDSGTELLGDGFSVGDGKIKSSHPPTRNFIVASRPLRPK